MNGDEARDRARAQYGRPDPDRSAPDPVADVHPTARTPIAQAAPSPVVATTDLPIDEAAESEPAPEARSLASRRRRASVAAGILVIGAVLTAVALVTEPQPSLSVFDREPTSVELEKLETLSAEGFLSSAGDFSPRLLLEAPGRDENEKQRVWAIRLDDASFLGLEGDVHICLVIESFGQGSGEPVGCMLMSDFERRGFVPLDLRRPALWIDGVQKVISWGPTGDARLIDPPTLPGDGPSPSPGESVG